ncbi:glycosyltransferase [Archangium violaceum]|uniref:glycosyltransferase n=1 Tax=Archangium violaceum TaxID=83451 RepID=UPI00193C4091|nr:glycosyltransferase [Archangium violaceum]QRK05454.1 glycosyltransferase [Archangium violaceum]
MAQDNPLVTVIIPMKNGGALLSECLSSVFSQQTDFPFDVLCVDSGSRNGSVDVIRSFPARLLELDPASTRLGSALNLAIQNSPSPFVALLSPEVVPADASWLRELLAPMRENEQVAGVFGRHVAPPGGSPSRGDTDTTFTRIRPGPEGWAHYEAHRPQYHLFSDNTALRRSVWAQFPFRDMEPMVLQRWVADILEAGYTKAYTPRAVVRDSRNPSPWTQVRRAFDEARFYREHFDSPHMPGIRELLRDRPGVTLGRDVGQALGWFLGERHELLPTSMVRRFSPHPGLGEEATHGAPLPPLHQEVKRLWRDTRAERGRLGTLAQLTRQTVAHWRKYQTQGLSRTLVDIRRALRSQGKTSRPWWEEAHYSFMDTASGLSPGTPVVRRQVDPKHLVLNWVVPSFGRGGGGHMTIFRTIQLLERLGHSCRIYLVDSAHMPTEPMRLQALVHEWYLPIAAPVRHLNGEMEPADVVLATSWNTAYPVRASHCAPARVYFIQDFEPAFYPMGAEWQFAEDTYRFGFYGLTAGPWLEQMMREKYGMHARSFPLAVEHDVYYPEPVPKGARRRVFAYMRPHTPRRGFQLAALALRKVKERFPEVEIHIAGTHMPDSSLPFPFVGHGMLDFAGLRRVFSSSDVALCISFTNYSLLPQEIAACGCPVVDIDVESTRAAYPKDAVVLAPPNVEGVAHEISHLLEDEPYRQRQIAAGFEYVRGLSWDTSILHTAQALEEFALLGAKK